MKLDETLDQFAKEKGWSSINELIDSGQTGNIRAIIDKSAKEYTRLKCLEAIRNTRYAAIDIVNEYAIGASIDPVTSQIQNINNKDVLPELD